MQLRGTKRISLMIILMSYMLPWSHEEVFTALADMETLVNVERELLSMLRAYINFVESRTQEMYQFINKSDSCYKLKHKGCKGCRSLASNPLDALAMLQRFLYEWSTMNKKLHEISSVGEEFKSYFHKKMSSPDIPGTVDLNGAALAIFRLQSTYLMNARSIVDGDRYLNSKKSLYLEDILELGKAAYFEKKMNRAKEWLDITLDMLLTKSNRESTSAMDKQIVEVREYLALAEYELGHNMAAWNHTVEILRIEPKHERALTNRDVLSSEIKESGIQVKTNTETNVDGFSYDLYEGLCRGDGGSRFNLPQRASRTQYLCAYKRSTPYLILKPVAYEVLAVDPEIIIFHNVIGDGDIDVVKELAYPKLVRATVNNIRTGVSQIADYRISKSGWLSDKDHEVIEKISRRLERVTGLASKTAEELQVANYGIGGHYDPHFDWARNFPISDLKAYGQGNRIATALLYMSDVEAGGGTAFLSPRVTVWPKKGSVAFWYNLYKNGTGKITTQHAACPVLLGSKWVANKWFHEYGQEFRRPCSLNRWE